MAELKVTITIEGTFQSKENAERLVDQLVDPSMRLMNVHILRNGTFNSHISRIKTKDPK